MQTLGPDHILGRTWIVHQALRNPAFAAFVGDLVKWSNKFWDTYDSLKHAPTFEYDASEVRLLGDSGAILLLGALLNGVAGNRTKMKVLCENHRTQTIGYNMRKLLR